MPSLGNNEAADFNIGYEECMSSCVPDLKAVLGHRSCGLAARRRSHKPIVCGSILALGKVCDPYFLCPPSSI